MPNLLDEIMNDHHSSIHLKVPILSSRDNIDLKDTIALLERQLKEKEMDLDPKITFPDQPLVDLQPEPIKDVPVKTRVGRIVKKPDRFGS